jgi:hypothetical protein
MTDQVFALADIEAALAENIEDVLKYALVAIIVVVICVTSTIRRVSTTRQREQTKRELAAYVAEGSISPDDAQRILGMGQGVDTRDLVLKRAADGWISAKKAEQILATMDKRDPTRA